MEEDIDKLVQEIIYDRMEWGSVEKVYQYHSEEKTSCLTLSQGLHDRLRKSPFGIFMDTPKNYNPEYQINKLRILKVDMKGEKTRFKDIIFENILEVIETALSINPIITNDVIFSFITVLRLIDCGIAYMDDSIRTLKHLKLLNLSGNWIREISGSCLPRSLRFLELFSNEIRNLSSLCHHIPKYLLHLGLARNRLDDRSMFHLLTLEGKSELRSIDFGGNDICDLRNVLTQLQPIEHLVALCLGGNPCSMCYIYREVVNYFFPELIYLDYIKMKEEEKKIPENLTDSKLKTGTEGGALCFYCFRIMGLAQPKKNDKKGKQKVLQTFHIELELPLFDTVLRETEKQKLLLANAGEEEEELENEVPGITEGAKKLEKKENPKKEKKSKKEKKGKGGKPKALVGPTEVEPTNILRVKTPRRPWSKIIEFPEPCIRVPTSEIAGLKELRDTFRSSVTARVIYLRTLPPLKEKKKKKKESKKKNKKEKTTSEVKPSPPQETVLTRIILGQFQMSLQSINWADTSLDYTWVEKNSQPVPKEATLLPGYVKELKYDEKGKKSKKKKKSKKGQSTVNLSVPVPTQFTCQMGFGLQRTFPDPEKDKISENISKTKKGKKKKK